MKKGLILCLVFMLGFLTACAQDEPSGNILETIQKRGKLIVGVKYDTYLFGYKDPADQQVKGFEVDLMKEFAKYLLGDENKVEFREVTSKTRIKLLNAKDVDVVVATMTITEQRKRQIDFTNVYFLATVSIGQKGKWNQKTGRSEREDCFYCQRGGQRKKHQEIGSRGKGRRI